MESTYDYHIDYPIAELLSCAGFFLLFALEEIIIKLVPSIAHGHRHAHGPHIHEDSSSTRLNVPVDGNQTPIQACCRLLTDDEEHHTVVPVNGDVQIRNNSHEMAIICKDKK